MDVEAFRIYCLHKSGVEETFPFDENTLVFKVVGKMFALTSLERLPFQVNLKCDPERAIALREEFPEDILPGYHMNKKHWNTVIFESDLSSRLLKEMIDDSYNPVVSKLTKKEKALLQELKELEK